MPLHEELEYETLHYTHPRHTLDEEKQVVVAKNAQYIVFQRLILEAGSSLTLDEGAELIIAREL